MTTLETVRLTPALEALIDARLNTIDRMLLDAVPRQDRLAIVRDVETQIHEQIQARETGELSREDVLAVLASLDPPEAYLPEANLPELSGDSQARPRSVTTVRPTSDRLNSATSGTARTSGVLGIVALIGSILLPAVVLLLALLSESGAILAIGAVFSSVLVLTGGILAIVFAARAGLRHGWAMAGLVTSLVAMPLVLFVNVAGFFVG
jgi:hypothetical protein